MIDSNLKNHFTTARLQLSVMNIRVGLSFYSFQAQFRISNFVNLTQLIKDVRIMV